ncbi:pimeloyl-ACP methyl ester carboxylesterase [Tamaricihabitans halophyticus]|uniref:Pimeloyl-ACP methyl ester carboxylesterase n=1 Tax=Tamaricihabitans halophyticus TaxID=1262583 RepID=A0A4R2QHG0_9PSEU|nr:pimeloyl-ACP methyl ester carboxylesterase [Tamaricihabitans halophyticus]
MGATPLPATTRAPSLTDAAGDVLDMLDRLGLPQVVIGGCEMGGYVAMAVLRAAPHRVAGLLLSDCTPKGDSVSRCVERLSIAERAETEGTAGWLAEHTLPSLFGRTSLETRSAMVRWTRQLIELQSPGGVSWAQRAMAARRDVTEILRDSTIPALVLVGEQNQLFSPAEAKQTVELLPYGELTVLPGVGQLSALEDSGTFAELVRGWLARF